MFHNSILAVDPRWPAYLYLAVFIALMIGVAAFSYKKSKTVQGFLLGDRGIGGWLSAFSYGTTYFSAVVFIGYAGKYGMTMGLGAIWIGIANAVIGCLLAWIVLAKRSRDMSQAMGTKTMPEFLAARYESKYLKLVVAVIVFTLLIPYATSVYQGIAYLAEAVFGLPFVWSVVIMAVLVGMYMFIGGYFANVASSFIQGVIMLIGVIAMIVYMLNTDTINGVEGIKKLIETGYGFFPSAEATEGNWVFSPAMQLIVNILLTSFGVWAVPQSVSKFYAIRNDRAIKQGCIISTLFAVIVGAGAYFNGAFVSLFDGTDEAMAVPNMLLSSGMSYWLLGLIGILVLSASMSTLSALAMTGSSTISVDLFKGYIKKDAKDGTVKLLMRILCFIFVIVSAILAIFEVDIIVNLMSLSWGTLAGCFIGPYIYGLYLKKTNKYGAYTSIVTGLLIVIIMVAVGGMKYAAVAGVLAMIVSMIVTPLASIIGKAIENKVKKPAEGTAVETEEEAKLATETVED